MTTPDVASARSDNSGKLAFLPLETYQAGPAGYRFLPFRVRRLRPDTVLVVSESGEFAFLSSETFQSFVTHRLERTAPTYTELKAKHFLVDATSSPLLDILATKYRTKKSFLAGFTKLHLFVVTLRCNHSCLYCQVSRQSEDKRAFDMSEATARLAVDLMLRTPSPCVTMEFQGGEPLLNFPLIQFMVEYAETSNHRVDKQIDKVIATNLSAVTPGILSYCRDHQISLSTSLDGPEWLHNDNRQTPGSDSHQRFVRNLEVARSVLGRQNVAALMTTTRTSLAYPREIIDEYVRLGFKSVFLRAVNPYGFAVRSRARTGYVTEEFLRFYRDGLAYIIELNRSGTDLVEVYAKILLTKILTPFPTGFTDLQSPSAGGIGTVVYNYDGDVYASDEARMLAEMGDKTFRLGNVHIDSYEQIFGGEIIRALCVASVNEALPGCSDCAYQGYCGADPIRHHATQGDVVGHRPTSDFCRRNMAILDEIFGYLLSGDPEVMRIFWAWITDRSVRELQEPLNDD